jgi:beta-xylosidase
MSLIEKVCYAPPGEYIKDHCLFYHKETWHFYSISGEIGHSWLDPGNEERISHSSSSDLINWQMHGHPVKASYKEGYYDEHMAVAPFVVKGKDGLFYMFYSGWRHPNKRPDFNFDGHRESIYMAVSNDLFSWNIPEEIEHSGIIVSDGEPIRGRDPHVIYDESGERWLLYYTREETHIKNEQFAVGVAESKDLKSWINLGNVIVITGQNYIFNPCESPFVVKHPISGNYILLLNWDYAISEDPLSFNIIKPLPFLSGIEKKGETWEGVGAGFARELIEHKGKNYMSGVIGLDGDFKLCFKCFSWTRDFFELNT